MRHSLTRGLAASSVAALLTLAGCTTAESPTEVRRIPSAPSYDSIPTVPAPAPTTNGDSTAECGPGTIGPSGCSGS